MTDPSKRDSAPVRKCIEASKPRVNLSRLTSSYDAIINIRSTARQDSPAHPISTCTGRVDKFSNSDGCTERIGTCSPPSMSFTTSNAPSASSSRNRFSSTFLNSPVDTKLSPVSTSTNTLLSPRPPAPPLPFIALNVFARSMLALTDSLLRKRPASSPRRAPVTVVTSVKRIFATPRPSRSRRRLNELFARSSENDPIASLDGAGAASGGPCAGPTGSLAVITASGGAASGVDITADSFDTGAQKRHYPSFGNRATERLSDRSAPGRRSTECARSRVVM